LGNEIVSSSELKLQKALMAIIGMPRLVQVLEGLRKHEEQSLGL
jgi:hypothetical protein